MEAWARARDETSPLSPSTTPLTKHFQLSRRYVRIAYCLHFAALSVSFDVASRQATNMQNNAQLWRQPYSPNYPTDHFRPNSPTAESCVGDLERSKERAGAMPVFHTKVIQDILDPVAQQVSRECLHTHWADHARRRL